MPTSSSGRNGIPRRQIRLLSLLVGVFVGSRVLINLNAAFGRIESEKNGVSTFCVSAIPSRGLICQESNAMQDETVERIDIRHPLKLKVPFYVYETDTLNWSNLTFQKHSLPDYSETKHSDDLWLSRASRKHPMRTHDPYQASLFFVPVLLNAAAERRMCIYVNETQKCFDRPGATIRFADRHLAKSESFQRSKGRDHVLVMSHWLAPPHRIPNLLQCNLINFEGRLPLPTSNSENPDGQSFFLPGFYVGKPCPSVQNAKKLFDLAMIGTIKENNPDFQSRKDICNWITGTDYTVSICGSGDQCPALAESKFGFHPRGDTLGSQRVIDTAMSRTVPLFTDERQYDILPPFIPWRSMSCLVNVSEQTAFLQSLQHCVSRPELDYAEKLRLIDEHMHLLDHTQIYQFDAYMAEFAQRLGLQ